jgi:hypothetical protein
LALSLFSFFLSSFLGAPREALPAGILSAKQLWNPTLAQKTRNDGAPGLYLSTDFKFSTVMTTIRTGMQEESQRTNGE